MSNVECRISSQPHATVCLSVQDYSMSAFIQQEWVDDRLMFFGMIDANYLELDTNLMKEVWVPDLYFTNEKKAALHDVTVPNRMMHLYDDGRIIYRIRLKRPFK